MMIYSLRACGVHTIQPLHFIKEKMKAMRKVTCLRMFNPWAVKSVCKPYLLSPNAMIISPNGSEVDQWPRKLSSSHAFLSRPQVQISPVQRHQRHFPLTAVNHLFVDLSDRWHFWVSLQNWVQWQHWTRYMFSHESSSTLSTSWDSLQREWRVNEGKIQQLPVDGLQESSWVREARLLSRRQEETGCSV